VLLFLAGLPFWAAILLLVVLPTIIAMGGTIVVRRAVGLDRLTSNNEIAGFKFATVGVIYAVLVAFAMIVVWEKFSEAQTAVVKEAAASVTLHRLAAGSDPKMMATEAALGHYLNLAVEQDWPRMAQGKQSHKVSQALDAVYVAALRLTEGETRQPALLTEIFKQLDIITEARRTRLHLATGIVPSVVWMALFCGAILTVAFTFFFGAQNLRAQVLMTGILSVLTFTALFAIVEIDHPFTGPSFVDSEPIRAALAEFSRR
jgi:hypothetical protein